MFALSIIIIFLLILAFIIYREYKNEKNYQQEREAHQKPKEKRSAHPVKRKTTLPKTGSETDSEKTKKEESLPIGLSKEAIEKKFTEAKKQTEALHKKEAVKLPSYHYTAFSHKRLVDMGFPEAEAEAFVLELIPLIATQMIELKDAMDNKDMTTIEHVTHDIKGSSSNIGTGGIADLIADFNTYAKTGNDPEILAAYFGHLERSYAELKKQYNA